MTSAARRMQGCETVFKNSECGGMTYQQIGSNGAARRTRMAREVANSSGL